jgi:hypothetical protein
VTSVSEIVALGTASWEAAIPSDAAIAANRLEDGAVLLLPGLAFRIDPAELVLFSPSILASQKNSSFDPSSGRVSGTTLAGEPLSLLQGLMRRFSDAAHSIVASLLPQYRGSLLRARASFRPAEIAGRVSSWRKDDTRLHVDSFPATPVHGRRILRLFANVNPDGRARTWRVGEPFQPLATRFAPSLSLPWPGQSWLLAQLHVTKSRRSPYDSLMLQLHDRMKQDLEYQRSCPQQQVDLPAGSTWIAFTDQVSHAALAGQYQLEQTFLLPVDALIEQARAPLRVLEHLKDRALA